MKSFIFLTALAIGTVLAIKILEIAWVPRIFLITVSVGALLTLPVTAWLECRAMQRDEKDRHE